MNNQVAVTNTTTLDAVFKQASQSINPSAFPKELFLHYSLPAFDELGGPALNRGEEIESNKTLLQKDSILVSKLNPRKPRVQLVRKSAIALRQVSSTEFISLVAIDRQTDLEYFKHLLNSSQVQSKLDAVATGTTNSHVRARPRDLFKQRIFAPPVPEQRRIAEILDTLDDQIRATEQIIVKLKRAADGLTSDVLTLGIDKGGRLRDPFRNRDQFMNTQIGVLPRDWEITSVGKVFDVQSGITLGPHRRPRKGSFRYLRVANVRRAALDLTELSRLQASVAECHQYALRENDLLVVEGHGDVGQIGRCARVDSHAAGLLHQNHLFRLRSSALNAVLAEAWLNSDYAKSYWRRTCSTSSGLNTINSRQLKAMVVGLPSSSEQERIAAILTAQHSRVDSERKILAGLQSLKQGLMADLLTGRVRVSPETTS